MKFNPNVHRRRTTRLRHWDYSWGWWYYVTIVVKNRQCRLGKIMDDRVVLSEIGRIANDCWRQIPQHHAGVELDEYVVMPNHIHGIVILNDERGDVQSSQLFCRDVQFLPAMSAQRRQAGNVPTKDGQRLFPSRNEAMSALSPKNDTLSVVVRTCKAAVTTRAREKGFGDFAWQGRFHDHIVRNEADLHRIRTYIVNNPLQWSLDEENPEKPK